MKFVHLNPGQKNIKIGENRRKWMKSGVKWIVKKLFITSDIPKILKKNWNSQGPHIKELARFNIKYIFLSIC